jgi:hypothetical protein
MHKVFFSLGLAATLFCITPAAKANQPAPGYWTVETHTARQSFTVLRFYNADNKLVGGQRLINVKLDVTKAYHRRQIEKRYQTAMATQAK